MEEIFTNIYEQLKWGDDNNDYYKGNSGKGSEIFYNEDFYIPLIKKLIQVNEIKTVVDLGCGDFKCGKILYDDLDITYTGYDTYKKIIDYHLQNNYDTNKYNFHHLDIYEKKEIICGGDLCIIKDVLQHWSIPTIYNFLDYLTSSKKFKLILICNCCNQKEDDENDEDNKNDGCSRPLSCDYLPLKKYNPIKLFYYNTKEVSIIINENL
jgi:hypothetical protein